MAFSLRLPPILDRQARAKADQLGLPLNGLICVALDAFLNGGGSSSVKSPLAPSVPLPEPSAGSSKAERRAFTENQRLLRKLGPSR